MKLYLRSVSVSMMTLMTTLLFSCITVPKDSNDVTSPKVQADLVESEPLEDSPVSPKESYDLLTHIGNAVGLMDWAHLSAEFPQYTLRYIRFADSTMVDISIYTIDDGGQPSEQRNVYLYLPHDGGEGEIDEDNNLIYQWEDAKAHSLVSEDGSRTDLEWLEDRLVKRIHTFARGMKDNYQIDYQEDLLTSFANVNSEGQSMTSGTIAYDHGLVSSIEFGPGGPESFVYDEDKRLIQSREESIERTLYFYEPLAPDTDLMDLARQYLNEADE